MLLSDNLKECRRKARLTQTDVADRLHVARQTLSKWENGTSVPDADMLQKLAEIYSVNVSALLGTDLPEDNRKDDYNEILAFRLESINEQMALRNARQRKALHVLTVIGFLILLWGIFQMVHGIYGYQQFAPSYVLGDTSANMLLQSYIHSLQTGSVKTVIGIIIILAVHYIGRI